MPEENKDLFFYHQTFTWETKSIVTISLPPPPPTRLGTRNTTTVEGTQKKKKKKGRNSHHFKMIIFSTGQYDGDDSENFVTDG